MSSLRRISPALAVSLVLLGGLSSAQADFDGRLPISPAEPIDPHGPLPEHAGGFWEVHGPEFVIYWDFLLGTPRYVSPRTELKLFGGAPNTTLDDELRDGLTEAALRFVDGNAEFLGVSSERLSEPLIKKIGEVWLEVQHESLGPALRLEEEYRSYWAYIPHFIHTPFYVYAYAFGDCLVNSLYAVYQRAADGFADKYLDMLRAGGTLRHKELLAPFDLDASDPAFWQQGLGVISGLLDELTAMDAAT